jgi:hypothetical protein
LCAGLETLKRFSGVTVMPVSRRGVFIMGKKLDRQRVGLALGVMALTVIEISKATMVLWAVSLFLTIILGLVGGDPMDFEGPVRTLFALAALMGVGELIDWLAKEIAHGD